MTSSIKAHIERINEEKRLVLSIFLTAGFPSSTGFVELALDILDAGADMLELGIPFSDPIADGPVIQESSHAALQDGVNIKRVFEYASHIKSKSGKPVILMGYANPVVQYGLEAFTKDASLNGVDGLIIPDIPLDEYNLFWGTDHTDLDRILLTTPTSSDKRIREIDQKSEGFVYCVSVTGTTGDSQGFHGSVLKNLERTYKLVKNNKMLIGFGVSGADTVGQLSPFCDGVIVGSAVIKRLLNNTEGKRDAIELIRELRTACDTGKK